MAYIKIDQLQKYVDNEKNWLLIGESPARECLVIEFKKGKDEGVLDDEMVKKTLYFQSRNGNVSIEFDESGLLTSIELS